MLQHFPQQFAGFMLRKSADFPGRPGAFY